MITKQYLPIGDYALLGDCHSTALVSREGSIDWACLRRFDRGSTFGRLLDHDRGGFFSIRPVDEIVAIRRRYRPNTMVLETTMDTRDGTMVLTDAFAMGDDGERHPLHQLIRTIDCTKGRIAVEVCFRPRFDYGSATPWLRQHAPRTWSATAGDDALIVTTGFDLDIDRAGASLHGRIEMSDGEGLSVVVACQPAHQIDPQAGTVDARLAVEDTTAWWADWSQRTKAEGPHADLVARSALVLKALCCAPTGAIIAAPTTSLPEIVGGTSNWDYRACWIRDATLTLDALAIVGHHEVARSFRAFIMRTSAGDPVDLQIMYGPYGQRRLPELNLDLDGWRESRPVRIGNAAASQVQLDMYGHLVDAVHLSHLEHGDISDDEWTFIAAVVDQAINRWRHPDAGIWEMRGPPRHYVHSKVMVWVALDRGIRLVQDHGFDGVDVDRWIAERNQVRAAINEHGVHPQYGHFVQAFDTTAVDASLLKLPLVGFVDACDERMITTVEVIQRELGAPNGFIRRHAARAADDGAADQEGFFLLCSCWLVEVLALQGKIDEATELFEGLAALANDVELFAEEYSMRDHEFLGNFPQAFTHLGLIAANHRLRACAPAGSNTTYEGGKQNEQGSGHHRGDGRRRTGHGPRARRTRI